MKALEGKVTHKNESRKRKKRKLIHKADTIIIIISYSLLICWYYSRIQKPLSVSGPHCVSLYANTKKARKSLQSNLRQDPAGECKKKLEEGRVRRPCDFTD